MTRARRDRTVIALLCATLALTLPRVTQADEPGAVEGPVLTDAAMPEYPPGETRAEVVEVTLVIGPDGAVREVRAAHGDAAFVAAVRAVIGEWRFVPATRQGAPVAAVIHLEISFTPPPPTPVDEPEPDPVAAGPGVPTPAPAPPPRIDDVQVVGQKVRAREGSLGRSDLRLLPGTLGDPLRAIEILPGVSPTVSGLPYFYIRGAPPNATAFYLDDVRLPYLFHVGLGPSNIHPALVSSVELLPASTDAELGRVVGAFVRANTMAPREKLSAEARLRAIDASGFVETPIGDSVRVGAGGLVSFTKPLVSVFSPDITIDYRDFQTRTVWDVTPRDTLTLWSFGSYDFASQITDGTEQVLFASELYRSDVRWDHEFGPRERVRVGATVGYDRSRLVAKRFARDVSGAARARYVRPLADAIDLKVGADVRLDSYSADLPSPDSLTRADYAETTRLLNDRVDLETGAYASVAYRVSRRARLDVGSRFDFYASKGATAPALEPRTALSYDVLPWLRVRTEHGIAHQPPAYSLPIPALGIGGLPGGLQESFQSSVTSEIALPLRTVGTTTLFRSAFSNLTDFVFLQSEFPLRPTAPESGLTHGAEVSLKRPIRDHWGLQVSYTLSRSTRTAARGATHLSRYDRPHVLNVALLFDLGRGWSLGGRILAYSGLPENPTGASDARLPVYYRIDARAAKRWNIGKTGYIGLVLEGVNVTANAETVGVECDNAGCRPRKFGPLVLPSVGLEGGL